MARSFFQYRQSAGFRLDQRFHFLDTPGSLGAYRRAQERVRADGAGQRRQSARHQRELQPHLLRRPRNATKPRVLFTEDRDRFYGPIFTLTISGTI